MKNILSPLFGMLLLFPVFNTKAQTLFFVNDVKNELTVKSNFNGKTYHLYVSLPGSYTSNDNVKYPVLYVLDGKYSFGSFHSIRQILDMGKEIEDVIIVAVADDSKNYNEWLASRHADFTPSHIAKNDTLFTRVFKLNAGSLNSGGASLFLKTLKNDIMPSIEKNYKTNGDNGLSGHSLGGLFAGYCLLVEPELFNRYGINSPSFWWDQQEITDLENTFAKTPLKRKTTVFISAGKLEGGMMVTPVNNFKDAMSSLNDKNLFINFQLFENETHLSVVPACSSRTLKVLYARK